MKTIYLHIGRGKTGTTLIQWVLSNRREELSKRGVHYIYADDSGLGLGHQQFAKSFIKTMPRIMTPAYDPDRVRVDVLDEIKQSPHSSIVLSSENFPLVDPSDVKRFFADASEELSFKIILFVRSQDELAESEYNQVVKLKHITSSFRNYAEHELEDVEFDILADRWANCFGKDAICCEIYDANQRDVLQKFFELLPNEASIVLQNVDVSKALVAENRSLGISALKTIILLNDIPIDNRQKVYRQIVDSYSGRDLPAICLNGRAARLFRAKYTDSNLRFSRKYLGVEMADLGGRKYSDEQRDEIFIEHSARGLMLV